MLSAAATSAAAGVLDGAGNPKWTSFQFANAYALYQLCLAVVGIFAGRIVDKAGPRKVVFFGVLVFSAGWFLTGFCTEIWQIYLVFGVLAGSGAGMVYNPNVTAALKWFPDKRGLMSGVLLASAALGPFTFSPVASAIVRHFESAQTVFRIFGVTFIVLMGISALFLQKADEDYLPAGYVPPAPKAGAPTGTVDATWKEMLASPLFYLMLLSFICATTAGNMFVGANYSIAQIQIGADASSAALAVSLCALANFFGRLLFGFLSDKIGGLSSLLLSLCVTAVTSPCSNGPAAFFKNMGKGLFTACCRLVSKLKRIYWRWIAVNAWVRPGKCAARRPVSGWVPGCLFLEFWFHVALKLYGFGCNTPAKRLIVFCKEKRRGKFQDEIFHSHSPIYTSEGTPERVRHKQYSVRSEKGSAL